MYNRINVDWFKAILLLTLKKCIDKNDAKCILPRKWICSNKFKIDVRTLLPFNFQLVWFVNQNKFIDRMEVNVNSLNTVFSLNIKYSLDANGNFIFDVFIFWLWFCPIFRLHKFPIEYCVNFITPQIPNSFNSFVKLKTDFWVITWGKACFCGTTIFILSHFKFTIQVGITRIFNLECAASTCPNSCNEDSI